MESSETLKCSELDSKAQNTLHLCFLGVIGKVLKRKYRKWPRIGHLDICSPRYGQKKGRESNWQFESRPLKVGNRPLPDLIFECANGVEKILTRNTTLVQTSLRSDSVVESYGHSKFRESCWDNFETPFRESKEFVPFGCSLHCELERILYGGRWWLPPSLGRGEFCVSKCLWLVPTPKGVPNVKLTLCGWFWMQIHTS